jgi:hypothetical protein
MTGMEREPDGPPEEPTPEADLPPVPPGAGTRESLAADPPPEDDEEGVPSPEDLGPAPP